MMPEFPIEKLNKEELLRLLVEIRSAGISTNDGKTLRTVAHRLREETLFQAYLAASKATDAAYDATNSLATKSSVKRAELHLQYTRLSDRSRKLFDHYRKFSERTHTALATNGEESCAH